MIVVTGGAGFIGRHLCSRLRGDVVVVDNGSTGRPDAMTERPRLQVVRADVAEVTRAELGGRDVEAIFHLASPASPVDYARMPLETLRTGSEGTRNMLEHARRSDAAFLLASTSEVYGDPEVHPQHEDYAGCVSLTGPRAVYDEAKRYAEALTYAYHRTYGLPIRVARIFNTYGPGMRPDDGRVVSTFMHRALQGRPLPVQGDGSQTRSFCYVDDLVDGLLLLMERGDARPVNLGNPEEVTVLDLAHLVHETVGRDTGVEFRPLPQDDPARRRPDTTRAEQLGWRPRITLRDGLARYHASLRVEVVA